MQEQAPRHLVSLGEALVELIREPDGRYRAAWGGDMANVLFYASRLGLRTGFVSSVGNDLFTPMILEGLAAEGIDTSLVRRDAVRTNGIYAIECDETGEYTFDYWRAGSAATQTLREIQADAIVSYVSGSEWFIFSGITLAVMEPSDLLADLLAIVRSNGTRIAFDANYRPKLWASPENYRDAVGSVLPHVDLFLPSLSDIAKAWSDDVDEHGLPNGLPLREEAIVAMKTGAEGCKVRLSGTWHVITSAPVEALDTTGAGDAFDAGMIAGLIREEDPIEAAVRGCRLAARTVRVRGALNMEEHG